MLSGEGLHGSMGGAVASATTADQTATSCPVAVACVSTMTMPSGSLSFSFSFNSDSKLSLGLHRAPARGFSGSSVSAARLFPPASFAARGEDDEEEQQREVAQDGRRAKVRMSKLLERLGGDGAEAEAEAEAEAREKAKAFLDEFFADRLGAEACVGRSSSSASSSSSDDDDADADDAERAELESSRANDSVVLRELRGLRRGSRRVVLQKLLQGGILSADPLAAEELKNIERSFRPPPGFRMKVVHIARTSKGTRAGGFGRFSALVVVGNGEGVLGWGTGKAVEVAGTVAKAQQSAYRNLYPVPRHNAHTITEEVTATFGKTKVVMYPKSSGRGIVANPMLAGVCQLAGIFDVGVKVHGSRNPQNTIKCLFAAFDRLRSEDQLRGWDAEKGVLRVPVPTGRFGRGFTG